MNKLITLTALTLAPEVLAGSLPTAELPEPATWALFGAAAVAILAIKKFKK